MKPRKIRVLQTQKSVDVLYFMPPKERWEAYKKRTFRPSVRQSVRPSVRPSCFCVRSISPIFFEVGIPNLVCGYILGWRSVAYHFRVTVTLTSDLAFRIIVSGAYLLYTETIKLCPLDVYVCQFPMYERISFKFSHYQL